MATHDGEGQVQGWDRVREGDGDGEWGCNVEHCDATILNTWTFRCLLSYGNTRADTKIKSALLTSDSDRWSIVCIFLEKKKEKYRRVSDSVNASLSVLSDYRVWLWPPPNFTHAIGVSISVISHVSLARRKKEREGEFPLFFSPPCFFRLPVFATLFFSPSRNHSYFIS